MYYTIKLIRDFIRILPAPLRISLGMVSGTVFYLLSPRKRRTAFINIKQAFPGRSGRELRRIVRKSFIFFGIAAIDTMVADRLKDRVEIKFEERPLPGEGHIIAGIHSGNWEVCLKAFADKNPCAVFVKRQRHKAWDRLLTRIREENRLRLCFTLKQAVKAVEDNLWLGMVLDHGAEKNALFVEFFGRKVPVPGGALRLAKRFGRKIYPSFSYRKGGRYAGLIGHPVRCDDRPDKDILRELNRRFETYLSLYPEQYLWWYKRFKKKKDRDILILSDGRTGHLKQALAFVEGIKEHGEYDIRIKTVEFSYRNRLMRWLAEIAARLPSGVFFGRESCLRFFLDKTAYDFLSKNFFDVVISAGSLAAPVNFIYAGTIGAKKCVLLKPNMPLGKFDLAVIPEHDMVSGPNVIQTKGALSPVKETKETAGKGRDFFNLGNRKKLALFLGSSLYNEEEYGSNLRTFVRELKKFSISGGYSLLVTTSRRTSPCLDNIIREELSGFEPVEAMVIVSERNHPFVVDTFLDLSELVFVSGDSVSMISESVYAGKPTVCVFLEQTGKRHLRFLNSLKNSYVNFLKYPYNNFVFSKPDGSLFEENASRIIKAGEVLFR